VARANTWEQRMTRILEALRETDRRLGYTPGY